MSTSLRDSLLAAFAVEHRDHLECIRGFLSNCADAGGDVPEDALQEAYRRAHSLKGAARAVEFPDVEKLAHQMETLFSDIQNGGGAPLPDVVDAIRTALDAIEDWVADAMEGRMRSLDDAYAALAAVSGPAPDKSAVKNGGGNGAAHQEAAPQPPASGAAENTARTGPAGDDFIRVRAADVNGLLLLSEEFRQELGRFGALDQRLAELTRAVESLSYGVGMGERGERSERRGSGVALGARLAEISREVRSIALLHSESHLTTRRMARRLTEQATHVRMVTADTIFGGFGKAIRDLAADAGKPVEVAVNHLDIRADREVLQRLKDPVMHLMRNAISHGIEDPDARARAGKPAKGKITLNFETRGASLLVEVLDDGCGLDREKIAREAHRQGLAATEGGDMSSLLVRSGFSTAGEVSEVAGRGVGLSVVDDGVRFLRGSFTIEPRDPHGCRAAIRVPLAMATHYLLFARAGSEVFALNSQMVERIVPAEADDLCEVEGRQMIEYEGTRIPAGSLAQVLGVPSSGTGGQGLLLRRGGRRMLLLVESVEDGHEGIVRDMSPFGENPRLSGMTFDRDGNPVVVLDTAWLADAISGEAAAGAAARAAPFQVAEKPAETRTGPRSVMVVDDSLTTRTLEKNILEAHGYNVSVCMDGEEALRKLAGKRVDVVVSDLEMPRLDGMGLLRAVKADPRLADIPVIIVTSVEDEEIRSEGLAIGAEAFIIKRKFDQRSLLETIGRLV